MLRIAITNGPMLPAMHTSVVGSVLASIDSGLVRAVLVRVTPGLSPG